MKKTKEIELQTAKISGEMIDKYLMSIEDDRLNIHHPAFINIDYDGRFNIEDTPTMLRIANDNVAVSLYKRILNIHITVFNT